MQKSYKRLEKALFQFALLFGFMLMGSSALVASTVSITASNDTYIYEASPTSNYGSATDIQIELSPPDKRKRGLVKWDLSSIPLGSTILSATIEIRATSAPNSNDASITINRVAEAWNETTATWSNFTKLNDTNIGTTIYGTIAVAKNTPGIKTSTDITPLVQQWVNGTAINYGVILRGSNNNRPVTFASKENSTTPKPTLHVTYEDIPCGGVKSSLTALNWKVISFPCNTGTNGIEALLGNSLGAYGNGTGQHWVMYEQIAYTGKNTTDMRKMSATDRVVPGKGYWIISDQNSVATVNTALTGLSKTSVVLKGNLGITTGSAFDYVHEYTLPNSQTDRYTKVMVGNPFNQKFQLSDMYFKHNNILYYPMGATENDPYVEKIVYAHDSANNGYIAIPPGTPGFGDKIDPMLGFWLLIKPGDTYSNSITYPLEK